MAFRSFRNTDHVDLLFGCGTGIRERSDGTLPLRALLCEKVEAAPLPMEQLMTKVAATLPDSVSVTGVNISSDPERAYQVTLSKPRRASMYVDQYTGEIMGKYERAPFFNFMFRMHRWLLDSMKQDGGIFWGR